MSMIEMIAWMRGGIPEACDFCGQPFTEANYPTPEEAGDWACISCVRKWNEQYRLDGVTQEGLPLKEQDRDE